MLYLIATRGLEWNQCRTMARQVVMVPEHSMQISVVRQEGMYLRSN